MFNIDIQYIQEIKDIYMVNKKHTCCFVGHREITETEDLKRELYETIETLIVKEKVDTFSFGSKSRLNSLCYELVTDLKENYPHIKRVYVRAEFPVINDDYRAYLLEKYEDTYYPEKIIGAGRAAYVERNYEMIDKSQFCVFYCKEEYGPTGRKSGTKIAMDYAVKHKKRIYKLPLLRAAPQAAIKG